MLLETRTASPDDLSARLAQDLCDFIRARQLDGGSVTIALTGGTMGIAMLRAVRHAGPALTNHIDWARVTLLWSDERWVPLGHADRNEQQAEDALLHALPLLDAKVLRMPAAPERHQTPLAEGAGSTDGLPAFPGSDDDPELRNADEARLDAAAAAYAGVVSQVGSIDLVLLGVGPDGHVASLFPGREHEWEPHPAFAVRQSPKPPAQRITLSMETINRADSVWLMVSGVEKHPVYRALTKDAAEKLPAQRVSGTRETRLYADAAAATGHSS